VKGKRYPTYLWPRGSDRQPSRMGALAVYSSRPAGDQSGGRREVQLARWEMEVWTARGGRPGKVNRLQSGLADDWLYVIARLLAQRGTLTVICPGVTHALALLRGWELIDSGVFVLEPVPLLLSDPPTSLVLTMPGLPGRLHLLDTRNYGVDISPVESCCERTGEFARAMVAALGRTSMGSLQDTAGAQALYGYRKAYMPVPLQTHCRGSVLALERSALHGGRAECHRLGRVAGPVYALDYTGYYTSIMRDITVPVRLRHYSEEWHPHGERLLREGYAMAARVKVRTEWPSYPCLRDGLTVWPVGTFWTVLCGTELQRAYALREIVEGGQWATYDTQTALRDYALACLALRADAEAAGDKDLARYAKSLGVSLVGKFAQQRRQWHDRHKVEARHRWGTWWYHGRAGTWHRYRSIAGLVQREEVGGETDTSFPAISAWIYAEGRARLWEAMLVAGRDNVYYTHTDSLFVSESGYWNLFVNDMIGGGRPGKLRLTAALDWIEILGVSHYRTPGWTVCSGVVGSGRAAMGDAAKRWYAESVGSALGEHRPPRPVEYRGAKETVRPYRHGVRGADGRVSPWRME
jgi:hypothetical protein